MKKKVTLKDIAKILGITEAAVSIALNNKPGVSDSTRQAVKELVTKLGYQPNKIAQALVEKKSKTIGLVVPDIENPYYSKMVKCVDEYLRESGYNLELAISNDDILIEKEIIKNFISKQVDGIIISPINKKVSDLTHYDLIIARDIPAVFIASRYPSIPLPCVMVDLRLGSYNLVNYLFKEGRRKIKFLTGSKDILAFSERIKGYKEAFNDNNVLFNENNIIECSRVDFQQAYFATINILKGKDDVDTIVTVNDYMALGVIKALYENNIRVPYDIAVAGYDDIIYASISNISITSVAQDIERMSQISVDIVLNGIMREFTYNEEITFIDPVLVVRASTIIKKG